jgi:hypothetical protein
MNTEFSEFDEQATSKKQALVNYWHAYAQYIAGLETWGVVDGYESAARNAGATEVDLDTKTVRRMVETAIERGGSCWSGSKGGFYSCPAGISPQVSAIRFYPD